MAPITVYVDDNYHYMDESCRTSLGEFETLKEAIEACKKIVDEYLDGDYQPGMSASRLYQRYKMFGEDPFITGYGCGGVPFSAWDYARERSELICAKGAGDGKPPG